MLQRVYVREHATHRFGAVDGLEVKVCEQALPVKSSVDVHLIIDAVNLKWTGQRQGIDAIAIASSDSDFMLVGKDIRTSTGMDAYGLWPASKPSIPLSFANSFTKVFRYGRSCRTMSFIGEEDEAELWNGLSELGYISSAEQTLYTVFERKAKAHHLNLFCHVHGLPWPDVGWLDRRQALAGRVFARLQSGEGLLRRPSHLLHMTSVRVTGSGGSKNVKQYGCFLILDMRGLDARGCVRHVMEFLGFVRRRGALDEAAIRAFARAQRAFKRRVELDDSLPEWALQRQVEYLFEVFTQPVEAFPAWPLWVRRNDMQGRSEVRSADVVREIK